jgi:fusaric acid resistance family protein
MSNVIARAWRWLTGDAWTFDPIGAGARVPALLVSIGVGAAMGRPLVGVLAAGGAYLVGFGAPLDLRGSKSLLLAVASVGIGASALVGSVAATHTTSAVLLAAFFGFGCGRAASRGPGPAWIALHWGLAAIIATSYPASLDRAALRALVILVGGLTQTGALAIARFARRRLPPPPPPDPFVPHYAVHLAIALAAGMLLERALALRGGYWVPMTALLVLRPDNRHTIVRVLSRVGGTIGGAALASGILLFLHPAPVVLTLLVALGAFGSYLFQKASYGLLSACITAYVVFILSLAGLSEREVAISRIIATALGGAIALAVQWIDWGVRRRLGTSPGPV